ncbi:transcriptional regulator [candidate division TA06 bacterium DG_26]|uniref:Probable transcriptional regulatory protein AMJ40_06225 n=1 Tax=candidate division TA06 bacterium DG_26 TaxID=1703771 RepID=A0A0S7WG91_UNCT6|nr:MAG: transcriptional regulator [candidate division TA06 bacterium DG_26]
MSGHSKWAQIKRKKSKTDAQRGKVFTRLIRELTVAARMGGGDPDSNVRLKSAITHARASNMPVENIERAIRRGTGELPGVQYEEVQYEGYGQGGVAIIVDVMTDNRKRTTSDLRHIFTKHGGSLGAPGCVGWMFETRGIIEVSKEKADEDTLIGAGLEAGCDDVRPSGNTYELICQPENLESAKHALSAKGITWEHAEVQKYPKNVVKLESKEAAQVLRLVEELEEHDDVQNVYSNFDIPDEVLEQVSK